MHRWLLGLWSELNQTVVLITHDLEEALLLSDRVYLMSAGPAGGLEEFSVDLQRPRHHKMNYEPHFIALRENLEQKLHDTQST